MMYFNCVLAAIAAVLVGSCLNKMSRASSCAVRWSLLLVLVACVGQAIGPAVKTWDHYVDTLMYGGIVAFLLANNRRATTGVPTRWAEPLACVAAVATAIIVIVETM